ncbi:MAG: PD-(D/E)XK nuclease family protein [Woeseia sp.]
MSAGMYSWLHHAVAEGAEVVTASRRLSRELRSAFDAQQVARGLQSWHTPRIVSWAAWLDTLIARCESKETLPLRLDTHNSALLWEQLLQAHVGERLLEPRGLVRQVQQTWQRLQDWRVPMEELERFARSEDERLFAAIAGAYRQELEENGWIDSAMLPALAASLVRSGSIRGGMLLVWVGFDRPAPAVMELRRALEKAGGKTRDVAARNLRRTSTVVACSDPVAELRSAGHWARRQLQAQPAARIAIVCPGLEQDAPRATRLIREGLAPGWQQGGRNHRASVNVSYGRRLADYPLVAVALLWLEWASRGLSSRDVSVLLRSPFAGRGHAGEQCRLELLLRRLPDRVWRPAALLAALPARDGSSGAARWLQNVRAVAGFEAESSALEPPAAWASRIDRLLQQVGWPGERPLDSAEFQLVNRWRELLNELSRLDVLRPRMKAAECVRRLSSFAGETVYQPDEGPGAIQLLGTLEAAGLEFDQLWVSGLDAQNWPPPANPLPLVSRELQRKRGMPDATPADTLEFSRRVLKRLSGSAANVILSWPQSLQDLELEPSPLLQPYLEEGVKPGEDCGWYAAQLAGGDAVGCGTADPAPPVRAGEKLGGGATTVQRQVDDPFSAFACGRLGAGDFPAFEYGLSASSRGTIIHRALHHLLLERPSSGDIAAWPDRDERIGQAVDEALAMHRRTADGVLLRLLDIERHRLQVLLQVFVEQELLRQDFRILAVEDSRVLVRHGVRLKLQIDRIDRAANGSLLIVDYKTGVPKSLLNRKGEPKELQLVVYASAVEDAVGGLLLLNLDSRAVLYKGAGEEWERACPEPWTERLERWKKQVDNAIAGIAEGDARLNLNRTTAESRSLCLLSRIEEVRREH